MDQKKTLGRDWSCEWFASGMYVIVMNASDVTRDFELLSPPQLNAQGENVGESRQLCRRHRTNPLEGSEMSRS